ncbi:hypothetical protein K525DRAFT_173111, partial [Schizophyllum commune Loenen D]
DPLAKYGAIDGKLPGTDAMSSHYLRCALMRYEYPHRDHVWTSFSEGVETVFAIPVQIHSLQRFYPPNYATQGVRLHCVIPLYLQIIAHLTVAANQIISALGEFFKVPRRRLFLVDPSYKLLELVGGHEDPQEVLMGLAALLQRLKTADKYIRTRFEALTRILSNDVDVSELASQRSTRSSVRSQFGDDSPRMELAKLALRTDYQ